MMIGGLILGLWSLNYTVSGNFPLSKPFWRTRSCFTAGGYRMYFLGWVLFLLGLLLFVYNYLR